MTLSQKFFDVSSAMQDKVFANNAETLKEAGKRIAKSMGAVGVLHTFGSGHSQILASEI